MTSWTESLLLPQLGLLFSLPVGQCGNWMNGWMESNPLQAASAVRWRSNWKQRGMKGVGCRVGLEVLLKSEEGELWFV